MIAWSPKDFVDVCGCPRPKIFRGRPYNVMAVQNFVGVHNRPWTMVAVNCGGPWTNVVARNVGGQLAVGRPKYWADMDLRGAAWSCMGTSGRTRIMWASGQVVDVHSDADLAVHDVYVWSPKIMGVAGCTRASIVASRFALRVVAQVVWAWTRKMGTSTLVRPCPEPWERPFLRLLAHETFHAPASPRAPSFSKFSSLKCLTIWSLYIYC